MPSELSAIVNLHDEGISATASLISAWRATEVAKQADLDVSLVLILDRPTEDTVHIATSWEKRGATVFTVDCGDLGKARNEAARLVDSQWLAFLDADDLWGEQWLVQAYFTATTDPPRSTIDVWHPQVNVIFGDHHSLLHHVASTSESFSWARFRLHNMWTALAFVRRSHLVAVPYPENDLANGFGFEDWSWNMEVLRRGGRHQVVPDSVHFIRRVDSDSLLNRSQSALRTPYRVRDEIARLNNVDLPGATETISPVTSVDTELPFTHRLEGIALSPAIFDQIRGVIAMEPAIADTIRSPGVPSQLPQNFGVHVDPKQQAIEAASIALRSGAFDTVSDFVASIVQIRSLESADRALVVADILLDPATQTIPRGDGMLVREALHAYPQLRTTTW